MNQCLVACELHLCSRMAAISVYFESKIRSIYFTSALFVALIGIQSGVSTSQHNDWGIQVDSIKNVGFSFTESPLNTKVGTVISKYPVLNVRSVEMVESRNDDFIDIRLTNDSKSLEFILLRPLTEFRGENWAASIELQYRLCKIGLQQKSLNYTFLLIIEDCNSYPPEFHPDNIYDFNISLPWYKDTKLNMVKTITITDRDINFDYANITVSCVEIDKSACCDNFELKMNKPELREGYVHSIDVYLAKNSLINDFDAFEEGSIFSFGIIANDSVHSVMENVTFTVEKVYPGKVWEDSTTKLPITSIVGIGSAIILLMGGAFAYTTWRNRQTKNILRKLTEAEIREFLDGAAGFSVGAPKRSVDVNTPILALPYNKAFEIQRDLLRIDETTVLGSGFFGVVMKGSVLNEKTGESTTVAVKAVKRNVGILYFKALLSELKIMAFIGRHNNIVSLIGACTHNIRKREVYIAVEFCANGNLHNFLRAYRADFISLVKDGKLCGFSGNYTYNRKGSCSKQISTLELIKWSTQISNGLDYLSSVGIIHGDLATRNILLDEERIAKIADFGLSRRLVDVSSYYYTKQSQAPLPWKWMSIESLKDMKFSKKSDVWSMGIVLWEIFSLGQTPYPGLNWDPTFVERLEKGLRLPQPPFASSDLYEIMRDCWTEDPHHRPASFDIKRLLEAMANSLLNQCSDGGYLRVLGNEKALYIGESDIIPLVQEETDEEFFYEKTKQAEC